MKCLFSLKKMKTILIFSNPFGSGPAGKALSIAKYLLEKSKGVDVILCGGEYMNSIAPNDLKVIRVNERDEKEILNVFNMIKGPKYVLSSQNRFVIKVAREESIPCAFLDGLSWFWKVIPEEHFSADIIFWLNYPGIKKRIPLDFKDKIKVVHGITPSLVKKNIVIHKKGVMFYLGGCKNPLTPIPHDYLNLFAVFIEYLVKNFDGDIDITTDMDSLELLKKFSIVGGLINQYKHDIFISHLSVVAKFVSNGGQTATLEAFSVHSPTIFFLPINLSQYALIDKLDPLGGFSIRWGDYFKLPDNFLDYSEKDAINYLNNLAKTLLVDKRLLNLACRDFLLLLLNKNNFPDGSILKNIGDSGLEDILHILQDAWGI